MAKETDQVSKYRTVKGRIRIKRWPSWGGIQRILYRGYQNWEVTYDLTKVNFKAVLEAGGSKAQWVKSVIRK